MQHASFLMFEDMRMNQYKNIKLIEKENILRYRQVFYA